MQYINMHQAKSSLSQLVEAIESGQKKEYIIARHGHPAARLVSLARQPNKRLGVAEGKFKIPDDIDQDNAEITSLFLDEANEHHP